MKRSKKEEDAKCCHAEAGASPPHEHDAQESPAASYYPLILIVSYLTGAVLLQAFLTGNFAAANLMNNFMGGFFVVFSFFKLLDRKGFADAYSTYDVLAKRYYIYGLFYPFIELGLGIAYLTGFSPLLTNFATLVVMLISSVGVVQSLLAKHQIQCACLGTVFNLPMTKITLVEDGMMALMAAVMLVHHLGHTKEVYLPGLLTL